MIDYDRLDPPMVRSLEIHLLSLPRAAHVVATLQMIFHEA